MNQEQVPSSIEIPAPWRLLEAERIAGTVLLVGASDTDKSTLVGWLVERLCPSHARVGWLDGDPGQSTLGLLQPPPIPARC
jgi:polynucleotide 5'-kinase involved in rRNA processing